MTATKNFRDHDGKTYLLCNLWILRLIETLRCLVPISAHALTGQLNLVLVFFNDLAETEIGDFDFAVVEDYVLGLQIVVDDLLFLVRQVLQT